jgi:threonyl-tRNA synthetase
MLSDDDHRAIGQRMDLFHQQEEAPGMVFWHPRGWRLFRNLEERIRRQVVLDGYHEVRCPQVLAEPIWRASGHWEHYAENMFCLEHDERSYALKPVNCPGHAQLFARMAASYRDLPVRLAEIGLCHRRERSGSLLGLMRLWQFSQDDGHIFCAPEHIPDEIARFCRSLRALYAELGFEQVHVGFSSRPVERAGDDSLWDQAEAWLAAAARGADLDVEHQPGQGAFYGPKLDFSLRDRRGRPWQCGSIQLDLVLPERFDLSYVDSSGSRRRPVMLHRALLGSLERFIAILLEHYRGALPPWLAPEQLAVLPISRDHAAYAREVVARADAEGVHVSFDDRSESLSRRIVDAHALGIPLIVAVGRREVDQRSVRIRERDGAQRDLALDEAICEIARRCRPPQSVAR